jgi:SAM-dependent methyltransferase
MRQPILEYCPTDHSRQVTAQVLLHQLAGELISNTEEAEFPRLLDLGCGGAETAAPFSKLGFDWQGVDIADSQEVQNRQDPGPYADQIKTFDGVSLPYLDAEFDVIYCRQVFEHVRHPEKLLAEIERVLRPGGYFVGSVSSLEPYHSHSYWSYTPFGFAAILAEAGLPVREFRPGIDGLSLYLRSLLMGIRPIKAIFNRWFERESPLNRCIQIGGRLKRLPPEKINLLKLQFSGHLCFIAQKPAK